MSSSDVVWSEEGTRVQLNASAASVITRNDSYLRTKPNLAFDYRILLGCYKHEAILYSDENLQHWITASWSHPETDSTGSRWTTQEFCDAWLQVF